METALIRTTCSDCGREHEAPAVLRGTKLECVCGATYRVGEVNEARQIRFSCDACERSFAVLARLAGRRVKCGGCQAVVEVPDPAAEAAEATAARDEARTLNALRRRIDALENQCGLGFAFFGVCVLALAFSLRVTLGASLGSTVALGAGTWFLASGVLFKLTRAEAFAYSAVLAWFVVTLPIGFLVARAVLAVNILAMFLGALSLPLISLLAAVFAIGLSVYPARIVKELSSYREELLRRELPAAA